VWCVKILVAWSDCQEKVDGADAFQTRYPLIWSFKQYICVVRCMEKDQFWVFWSFTWSHSALFSTFQWAK
jgi:hypothetical protein